ncbi:MAG: histidine phosphatase family protein [Acidobacteria bacterium]|nr:histidine phosphatase family protein [Acidobacteriota bacterium]
MTTTRLYLVRHGATQMTAENRFSGEVGAELSDEGRRQAARLGDRLQDDGISAVYASPLSRSMDTARIIAGACGVQPVVIEGLREISHGSWEGLTRREVEDRYPKDYAAWEEDPFTFAPPGAESGVAVLARALPAIRQIITAHEGQSVLVVSHKATIRLVLCGLLGIDARGYRDRLDQSPACLNVLDFKDPVRARLTLFNDTSHYDDRPRESRNHLSKWW